MVTYKLIQEQEFCLVPVVLAMLHAEPSETCQDSNLLMLRGTQLIHVNHSWQTHCRSKLGGKEKGQKSCLLQLLADLTIFIIWVTAKRWGNWSFLVFLFGVNPEVIIPNVNNNLDFETLQRGWLSGTNRVLQLYYDRILWKYLRIFNGTAVKCLSTMASEEKPDVEILHLMQFQPYLELCRFSLCIYKNPGKKYIKISVVFITVV